MTSSARANQGCVVRAGESYQGKQGPNYTPGISAQSAGSQAIWLGSGTLPALGGLTNVILPFYPSRNAFCNHLWLTLYRRGRPSTELLLQSLC